MTALLDPRRHAAHPVLPPPPAPARVPKSAGIQANAGGAVALLPGATREHLMELRRWVDEAMQRGERR